MENKNYEQEGLNFGPWIFILQSNVRLSKIDRRVRQRTAKTVNETE